MATLLTRRPVTASKTFSFYVGPDDRRLIQTCAAMADAVTIRGKDAPAVVSGMRRSAGFDGTVLFDREAWKKPDEAIDAEAWFVAQEDAGADRILTPGAYVPWSKDEPERALSIASRELELASRHEATPIVALDARWVGRVADRVVEVLSGSSGGVALVLVDPGDPLAVAGAVQGLRHIARGLSDLLILRSDHGALGAVAFGAQHASLGLITSHRHGTTPDRSGFGKPGDLTARVFSLDYADWFTAATIAGWSLVEPRWGRCHLSCCHGAELSRFLDEDRLPEVRTHNLTALARLADLVLDAPPEMRRATFLGFCRAAADRYDLSGHRGPQDPKPQLTGWVLS